LAAQAPTIAAITAAPIPSKTTFQGSAMRCILSLEDRRMSEEPPRAIQEITSGKDSHNIQAGRDVTVHNHPAPELPPASLIIRPTNSQIVRFDPKTREIWTAVNELCRLELPLPSRGRSPVLRLTGLIFRIVALLLLGTVIAGISHALIGALELVASHR
jgi:hypothetical protein